MEVACWEGRVLAISLPTASNSGDISTQSYLQTRETSLHCCLLISRNGSIPPGPLKNLPYHLSAVSGTSAPGKKKINISVPGSLGARTAAGSHHRAPSSLSPFPAASSAGAPAPGAWVWCRAG